MNKPQSMSHKDFLIRTLAVKLSVNEKMIEAIVNHQFQSANEAMDLNHSIELSGFGKFSESNHVLSLPSKNRKLSHRTSLTLISLIELLLILIISCFARDAAQRKGNK